VAANEVLDVRPPVGWPLSFALAIAMADADVYVDVCFFRIGSPTDVPFNQLANYN